jgi:tetratricopeptide (TPR) repeat protein
MALTAAASSPAEAQETSTPDEIQRLLTQGYALLPDSPESALPLFERAVQMDSSNLLALRQAGSLYISLGRPADAFRAFQAAYRRAPSDTLALQLAYLASSLGQEEEAFAIFQRLRRSESPEIQETARPAATVLALMLCADQYPWWMRGQAYPFYDTRFENFVAPFSFYGGRYLEENRVTSLYGVVSVVTDTRSEGGAYPVIFSDDYALAGGGFRFTPLVGLTADIQFGLALNLLERPTSRFAQGDFRAVASYGLGLYAPVHMPNQVHLHFSPFAEFYTSMGYYTRYENGIGYLQGKAGLRILEYMYSAADLYLRLDASIDTRRDFFNNVAEGGAGLRFIPNPWWGVALAVEWRRGLYWQSDQSGNPYDRYYSSVRLFLLFDRFFCW